MAAKTTRTADVLGWHPSIPKQLEGLLIKAAKHDLMADLASGKERRKHFRRKTQAMLDAHARFPNWFFEPFVEGIYVVLTPKPGWPCSEGVRLKMHIPIEQIAGNPFWNKRYGYLAESRPRQGRRPTCDAPIQRWPRRLCPRAARPRSRQRYHNRTAPATA